MLTPVQILRQMEQNCHEHCEVMEGNGIPITLLQYVDYKKEFNVDTTSRIKMSIVNCQATKR